MLGHLVSDYGRDYVYKLYLQYTSFPCHIWCDWTKDHAEKYWESGSKILSEKDREYIQEDILEYFPAPAKTVMSNE